ncbi:MAG: hypothetical protein U1F23_01400 [Lysobacterales bacterium]
MATQAVDFQTARLALALAMLILTGTASSTCLAEDQPDAEGDTEPSTDALQPSGRGHGSISVGFQDSYVRGLRKDNATVVDSGNGRLRAIFFDVEYFFADAWSVHVGIPYVSNVFNGSPHCPTTRPPQCQNVPPLDPQHPESKFQDDGRYHGTWQDWNLGVAWHTAVFGNYLLTPSLDLHVPSHDYVFFSNAAAGPGYSQLEAAFELAHQFDFTNLYYRVRYGYTATEHVLDTRMNFSRLELEFGWFVDERLTLRSFATGKKGMGYTIAELGPLTNHGTNDYWYHHDQIVVHDYASLGVGADYHFGDHYTLSGAFQKLIWGTSVSNFVYSADVRLTRDF